MGIDIALIVGTVLTALLGFWIGYRQGKKLGLKKSEDASTPNKK